MVYLIPNYVLYMQATILLKWFFHIYFQYSNVHATTPEIYRLSEDKDLQDECVRYVRTQGKQL